MDQTDSRPEITSPTLREELERIIRTSLNVRYTSESCCDRIKTGNGYQSIQLGSSLTRGFRTDRRHFLDRIRFEGKKVLDLGSNLGEISRSIRSRGAWLVDGFEYDTYFLEIARAANALNGVTRVSFFQHDITDCSIYKEKYDIVVAFSVFIYARKVLAEIASITEQLFVLETHKLEGDLESSYLEPVRKFFPFYKILGESEWGGSFDKSEKRVVIAFAKSQELLRAALAEQVPEMAVKKAEGKAAAGAAGAARRHGAGDRTSKIDVKRTTLHDRFFSVFDFEQVEQLIDAVRGFNVDLGAIAECNDLRRGGYLGWSYWLIYLKGYLQYTSTASVGQGNIYYDFMTVYHRKQMHDPRLSEILGDPAAAISRISLRFRDTRLMENKGRPSDATPVLLMVSDPPAAKGQTLTVHVVDSQDPLSVKLIDGWHRLFSAKLFGIDELTCLIQTRDGFQMMLDIVPVGATILVVSKGDEDALELGGRRGWHFPRGEDGAYTGYHPGDSAEAISHLEALREKGGQFLLFPTHSLWWLDHYTEFSSYLKGRYRRLWDDGHNVLFDLRVGP